MSPAWGGPPFEDAYPGRGISVERPGTVNGPGQYRVVGATNTGMSLGNDAPP
jgi:hypothetical protein